MGSAGFATITADGGGANFTRVAATRAIAAARRSLRIGFSHRRCRRGFMPVFGGPGLRRRWGTGLPLKRRFGELGRGRRSRFPLEDRLGMFQRRRRKGRGFSPHAGVGAGAVATGSWVCTTTLMGVVSGDDVSVRESPARGFHWKAGFETGCSALGALTWAALAGAGSHETAGHGVWATGAGTAGSGGTTYHYCFATGCNQGSHAEGIFADLSVVTSRRASSTGGSEERFFSDCIAPSVTTQWTGCDRVRISPCRSLLSVRAPCRFP